MKIKINVITTESAGEKQRFLKESENLSKKSEQFIKVKQK